MTQTGLLVRASGDCERVSFERGASYDPIKKALNQATITFVEFAPDTHLGAFIDDESKLVEGYHVNPVATVLWAASYGAMAGFIAGDVLFVHNETDGEGETLGLSEHQLVYLERMTAEHFRLAPRFYTEEPDGSWVEHMEDGTTVPVEGEPEIHHGFTVQRSGGTLIFTDI